METYHPEEHDREMVEQRLKGWEEIAARLNARDAAAASSSDSGGSKRPTSYAGVPFTLEGFIFRLARWIVVDDQVRCASLTLPGVSDNH